MTAKQAKIITDLHDVEINTLLEEKILKGALQGRSEIYTKSFEIDFFDIIQLEKKGYQLHKPYDAHDTVIISWK